MNTNLDLTDSVVLDLAIEKNKTLDKTIICKVNSENAVGLFNFSGYSANLTVKKKANDFANVLLFSTDDNSIVLGSDGDLSLKKTLALTNIRTGQYVYELTLTNTGGTRGFLRGNFLVVDESYGALTSGFAESELLTIYVKSDVAITERLSNQVFKSYTAQTQTVIDAIQDDLSYLSGGTGVIFSTASGNVNSLRSNIDVLGQGTVTLTNGSANIIGIGSNFLNASDGTGLSYWYSMHVTDSSNRIYRIDLNSINSNTSATILSVYSESDILRGYTTRSTTFTGTTGTYQYKILTNYAKDLYAFSFGNKSYARNYGTAFGGTTIADGQTSFAIGTYAQASGNQSFAMGTSTVAAGEKSFAGGYGSLNPGSDKRVRASGISSFNFSQNTAAQTIGHGALGQASAILGGFDHNIPSNSFASVILGGDTIKVPASTPYTVFMPKVRIGVGNNATIVTNNSNNNFLVRNASTGEVELRPATFLDLTSSQVLTNKTLSTGTTFSAAPTISSGAKFTFTPSATVAGFNVGSVGSAPSALVAGDMFYNTATGNFSVSNNLGTNHIVLASAIINNAVPFMTTATNIPVLQQSTALQFNSSTSTLTASNLNSGIITATSIANAGIRLNNIVNDPSAGSLANGYFWYNSTTHEPKMRISGITESFATKRFVTGLTSTTTANNGLTKNGNNIQLGGNLTGNTSITTSGSSAFVTLRANGTGLFQSARVNGFEFGGTWTGVVSGDSHVVISPTITSKTAGDFHAFAALKLNPTLIHGSAASTPQGISLYNIPIYPSTPGSGRQFYIQYNESSVNDNLVLRFRNSNSGTTASSRLQFGNDQTSTSYIQMNSSTNSSLGGSNSLNLNTSNGGLGLFLGVASTVMYSITNANAHTFTSGSKTFNNSFISFVQPANAHTGVGGSVGLNWSAGAHTNMQAGLEYPDWNINLARTVQFAGSTPTQRAVRIQTPTYSAVGASTINNAATLSISNAPVAGTNMSIVNRHSIWVEAGDSYSAGKWRSEYQQGFSLNAGTGLTQVWNASFSSANMSGVRYQSLNYNNPHVFSVNGSMGSAGQSYSGVTLDFSFTPIVGTGSFRALAIRPILNSTSTHSGTIYGIDYNPVLTSIASGATHNAARFASGNVLISAGNIDVNSTTRNTIAILRNNNVQITVDSPSSGTFRMLNAGGYGIQMGTSQSIWNTQSPSLGLFSQNTDTFQFALGDQSRNPTIARTHTTITMNASASVAYAPTSGTSISYQFTQTGLSAFQPITGNATFTQISLRPTLNSTGTHSGSLTGLDYNPIVTSIAANATHIAARFTSGAVLIGTGTTKTKLDVQGSVAKAIHTISTTTTLDENYHTVLVNAAGGTVTVNLPAASTCARRIYVIKLISATNTAVIDGNGAETIDGATTNTISTQNDVRRIQSNGTAWYII